MRLISNDNIQTSLLLKVLAQTLSNATLPTVKVHPFDKIAVPLNHLCNFDILLKGTLLFTDSALWAELV